MDRYVLVHWKLVTHQFCGHEKVLVNVLKQELSLYLPKRAWFGIVMEDWHHNE